MPLIQEEKFKRKDFDKKDDFVTIKHDKDGKLKEILDIGRYALNIHTNSTILKDLAEIGLKVILNEIGVEKMHRLTRGDRRRLEHEKPNYVHFKPKS